MVLPLFFLYFFVLLPPPCFNKSLLANVFKRLFVSCGIVIFLFSKVLRYANVAFLMSSIFNSFCVNLIVLRSLSILSKSSRLEVIIPSINGYKFSNSGGMFIFPLGSIIIFNSFSALFSSC